MIRSKSFQDNKPILYLIATPIGNLKEMSPRAIDIILDCDLVAAEDTRNAQHLLSMFNIKKETFSLREHNEVEASSHLIKLIKSGKKIVYMSDAGYPCVSDPGNILTRLALQEDINVTTISGSSAFLVALVSSGLPSDHFYFHGFLSSKESDAKKELMGLKAKNETLIFYESPHRIGKTISLLYSVLGPREAVIARELTKINEEFIRGTLDELVDIDPSTLIGEMVLIVGGNSEESTMSDRDVIDKVACLLRKGLSKKDAVQIVSDLFNISKNRIKDLIGY